MGAHLKYLASAVVSSLIAIAGIAVAAEIGRTADEREFINKAAQGGQMEVLAGKLAVQRALDPAVKDFGQKMASDHTAANAQLKKLAESKLVNLPDSVSPEEHTALGKLEGLTGADFDKAYSRMMVKDHETDISDFQKEIKKGQDADVKAFAEQTLPTLQHHLMLAKRLSAAEKKSP